MKRIEKTCLRCDAGFTVPHWRQHTAKYCGAHCRDQALGGAHHPKNGVTLDCKTCARPFYVPEHRVRSAKYCSYACRNAGYAALGNKRTRTNKMIRATAAYREWRAAVFSRDNFTCFSCHQRGGVLEADHIKPFALYPSLRFDVGNGRTVCRPCHRKVDTTRSTKRLSMLMRRPIWEFLAAGYTEIPV